MLSFQSSKTKLLLVLILLYFSVHLYIYFYLHPKLDFLWQSKFPKLSSHFSSHDLFLKSGIPRDVTANIPNVFIFNHSSWTREALEKLPLSAYLEESISYWIPNTADESNPFGQPIIPLPLRRQSPSSLTKYTYPKVQSCLDIPKNFPVARDMERNEQGKINYRNLNNKKVLENPFDEAPYCPVDADAFLPWIHDVFPSTNGDTIHFIAQNKRRCNQGKLFGIEKERLEPQVALMQPISVVSVDSSSDLSKNLWDDGLTPGEKRWRLSTVEEADDKGKSTRFICRFKRLSPDGKVTDLGQTLSTFPINYEIANKLKGFMRMLTKPGIDKASFWLSNFQFDCPVPDVRELQEVIKEGRHIISHKSTIYVDVVPIRTPPRIGEGLHYDPKISNSLLQPERFDAAQRWGKDHILPKINASGRWENIPVCSPSNLLINKEDDSTNTNTMIDIDRKTETNDKPHYLVGCLWASLLYKTRGNQNHITDTEDRLTEWLEFHLLAGFDHIYIYDNSAVYYDDGSNLSIVTDKFSSSQVTRIEWPFPVCNNNIPAHENTGERSSQYAAESSCRSRFGPHTEWMASFDTDEYFVPIGKYTNLKSMLKDAKDAGTNILSFRSTRASLNYDYTIPYINERGQCQAGRKGLPRCLIKNPKATFLQTYNCEDEMPKPERGNRAKKQIYRPDYVLSHFVHYSTITKPMTEELKSWRYRESAPSERYVDELNEAVMVHTKTMNSEGTVDWQTKCKLGYVKPDRRDKWKCRVGFPYPKGVTRKEDYPEQATKEGYELNCFPIEKISDYWVPRLEAALLNRKRRTTRRY